MEPAGTLKTAEKDLGLHADKKAAAVTYGFGLLFLAMTGYLVYFTATGKQDMMNNSYNSRQEILLAENYRGTIFSAEGAVLAETVTGEAGEEERKYPCGPLFAHAVGYSTHGKTGIEKQANYYLINSDLSLSEKVSNEMAGRKNPGNSVYTTLDENLQTLAADCLAGYKGAIVISEPDTGKILAMVSSPDFDPNGIADLWDELLADENNSALLNRVTQGKYPPGSVFDLFIALAYIRENPDVYADDTFDMSFDDLCAEDLLSDSESFADLLDAFLFNQKLPVAFEHAESFASPAEDADALVSGGDAAGRTLVTAAGEQWKVLLTPLHLHMMTSAIANGGVLMKPYVIDRVETVAGDRVKTFSPKTYGRILTEQEAAVLTGMMEREAESREGLWSADSSAAACKEGMVEYNSVRKESTAWFTGFAPAKDPQICVTIIIEGTKKGGSHAAPVAKSIFEAYFSGREE